jgi:hypothetical protein
VNGQTVNAVGPATDAVNAILTNFTMKMFLTRPTQTFKGSSTAYDAGSLIIEGPGPFTFEFGGAHVTAGSTLPFDLDLDSFSDTGSTAFGVGDFGGVIDSFSSLGTDVGAAGVTAPLTPRAGVRRAPALQTQLASSPGQLPKGVSPWWPVLGVIAVLALAGALRNLPDRVLNAASVTCEEGARR